MAEEEKQTKKKTKKNLSFTLLPKDVTDAQLEELIKGWQQDDNAEKSVPGQPSDPSRRSL